MQSYFTFLTEMQSSTTEITPDVPPQMSRFGRFSAFLLLLFFFLLLGPPLGVPGSLRAGPSGRLTARCWRGWRSRGGTGWGLRRRPGRGSGGGLEGCWGGGVTGLGRWMGGAWWLHMFHLHSLCLVCGEEKENPINYTTIQLTSYGKSFGPKEF